MSTSIIPIFDGHNDTLLHVYRAAQTQDGFSFLQTNETGHLDLPRAKTGGLAGAIFAIFTPTPPDSPERAEDWGRVITATGYRQQLNSAIDPTYARDFTTQVIAALRDLQTQSAGALRLVTDAAALRRCIAEGVLAVVLHFEGAEAVAADLSNLEDFYQQGLRSLGIVWSRPNVFAEGVPFAYPATPDTGPGLTEAGKALVRACNRLGILIDLAHINERGFWDVAALTTAPLVVSHTDVHALLPSTRNLTDAQIDAVGASGGLIGLNFEPMQIGLEGVPAEDVPLAALMRHVRYVADRIGVDHVGFGSDFDGTHMPAELKDASGLQKLITALRAANFTAEEIDKIAYQNWLRVLAATWHS